jgi:hypothetical protein
VVKKGKMWFFKKKVTKEEFQIFEKQIQKSLEKLESKNQALTKQFEVITVVTFSLIPLSKQFTELIKQFNRSSLNYKNSSPNSFQKNPVYLSVCKKSFIVFTF